MIRLVLQLLVQQEVEPLRWIVVLDKHLQILFSPSVTP